MEAWPHESDQLLEKAKEIKSIEAMREWRSQEYAPFIIRTLANPLFYMLISNNKVYNDLITQTVT